jgi:ATP-dependent Clp endopeptidase proteolytic subunit ClpP
MIFQVQQNSITAYGQIWEGNGMEFVSLFSQLEAQYNQIIVKLHSYGGSVFDGNLIYNTIQNSKKNIDLQIIGIAASMAAIISQSRKDKKPSMVRNGFMMIHAPSGSTYGSALDHENNAKLMRSMERNFTKLLATSISKPENYVSKWMSGDNWFDAEQALKEGLISAIIEPESDTITAGLNPKELGAEAMYYQFTALLNPENPQINLDHNMKKPIIEALALQGVNEQSSDTAVIEAVKKHFEAQNNILQGQLDAEITKRKEAEKKLADQGKAAITAELDQAKKEGKITAEQMPTYEGIATASGIEALKTVLKAIPARQTITGQMPNAGGKNTAAVGRETWDWDKWQKEDPKGFEALSKENPEEWQALYNQKFKK